MNNKKEKKGYVLVIIIYLLGIFMGAIDTGIVTPARTVIQNALNVDPTTGIWMITIYTLSYAASIPVMGKLADKYGRKNVYLISIFLFGFGSLMCGLSSYFGSFSVLLIARAVQAIGGGGILPIATAEFGTSFPEEKRGMALGLVGGVYGIANIFGSSAGSAIMDIFGTSNWQFIFFINVPITIFILLAGWFYLPNTRLDSVKKIDAPGILVVVGMILCLLYGLKNIDFFDFSKTFLSTSVYPFLIAFVLLLPLFIWIEKHAEDPVINLGFFRSSRIVITLLLSFMTGFIMMGMIFVPQFSENALKIASGKGGYFVLILGIFSGFSAPVSGKLIDRFGVKPVLGTGFLISFAGSLFLVLVTLKHPSVVNVVISLILFGLGIGFTIGTPLNYMMLDNTRPEEANSALATVSLIRSIGTAIAPAIMVGFISHAGMSVQADVMALLPTEVSLPPLPYAEELDSTFAAMKEDPSMKSKLEGITFPELSSYDKVPVSMTATGDMKMSEDLIALMQSSDVTTIVDNSKTLSSEMFQMMTPSLISNIQDGISQGMDAMQSGISGISMGISQAKSANQSPEKIAGMEAAKSQLEDTVSKMQTLKDAMPDAFASGMENYLTQIEDRRDKLEDTFQAGLSKGFQQVFLTVTISSLLAFLLLLLYRPEKKTLSKKTADI